MTQATRDKITQGYDELTRRLTAWAETQDGIRAAVLIGSRARADHPADEWSDLDVLLVVRDMAAYTGQAEWVAQVGEPWLTFIEQTGDGRSLERRALFAGGLDVDFAFFPDEALRQMFEHGAPPDALDVFRRGARVLIDKDGLAARMLAAAREPAQLPAPPSEGEFLQCVNDFWYHTLWTAKHLRRGELWWAKSGCDERLKYLLRQMLEWQARAAQGPGHDTWLRGRFLEEWADPRALAELPGVYAHYDAEDVWRALLATMDLFRWTSQEVEERLGFSYPTTGAEHAAELVGVMFEGRGSGRSSIAGAA
jgi:aminoglycoside 6-adenylyltransferase